MARIFASTVHGVLIYNVRLFHSLLQNEGLLVKTFQLSPEKDMMKIFITGSKGEMKLVKSEFPKILAELFSGREIGDDRTARHDDRAEYVISETKLAEVADALKEARIFAEPALERKMAAVAVKVQEHRRIETRATPFAEYHSERNWSEKVKLIIAELKSADDQKQMLR